MELQAEVIKQKAKLTVMANEQQARAEAENVALKKELKEALKMNAKYEA